MRLLTAALVVLFAALFVLTAVPAAPALGYGVEDLHGGVAKDCGDGKTYSKLGPKWKTFPVTYSIEAPDGTKAAAVNRAFATFEALEHPAGVLFQERTGQGQKIDVSFAAIDGSGNVLARTSYWYNRFTREFVEVNIVFDSAEDWVVYDGVTCSSQGNGIDVEAVSAHELGHGVGLGHSSSSSALTMYPYYSPGATHQRTLATGDVKGVANLYP
jgi:hypothetical protein